ncbi:alkaline phosphatase family protein [Haladaptatus sp. CMSO5]|uniref:alkaline phosphatase family protein n=1 Tax=Haladaptatus sp. CMSO5 TaxID=3120514 RepID=UPI002FCE3C20
MVTDTSRRAFILGLDGIPWNLIEQWTETEDLPNFARLIAEGASGPLESSKPANTPVAWPSIATGTWPDRHGIYEFMKVAENYTQRPYTRNDIREPTLWEMLTPAVVANLPMTYPPAPIDGKLVTGMMTPSLSARFAFPESLEAQIKREIPDYQIELRWHEYDGRKAEFLEELTTLVENRRQLMRLLMADDDWRLFFFVYVAPDRLQHLIWDEAVLLAHYQLLDEILGEVMDYATERDATLFVVSDHGFGPIDRVVSVNRLLVEEGFLVPKSQTGTRGVLSTLGITKPRVLGALARIGLTEQRLVHALPDELVNAAARQIPGTHQLHDVDHSQTTAFLHGLGSIYLNDTERFDEGIVAPAEKAQVKTHLMGVLERLTDPETGERVLTVYDGATLNPRDPDGPDIVVTANEGYLIEPTLSPHIIADSRVAEAYHRPEGIFFAWGSDIEAGVTVRDATVVDVAPTVLHAAGEPVSSGADGRVLAEIFTADSTHAVETREYTRSQAAGAVAEDYSDVEDRLRGLGYLE